MIPWHENESLGTTCLVVRSRAKTSVSMLWAGIWGWIWYPVIGPEHANTYFTWVAVGSSGAGPPFSTWPRQSALLALLSAAAGFEPSTSRRSDAPATSTAASAMRSPLRRRDVAAMFNGTSGWW